MSTEKRKLNDVYRSLDDLFRFLRPYLPLANAHNIDFFVVDHWNTSIHPSVAEELLNLTSEQLTVLPSGKLFPARLTGNRCSSNNNCSRHKENSQAENKFKLSTNTNCDCSLNASVMLSDIGHVGTNNLHKTFFDRELCDSEEKSSELRFETDTSGSVKIPESKSKFTKLDYSADLVNNLETLMKNHSFFDSDVSRKSSKDLMILCFDSSLSCKKPTWDLTMRSVWEHSDLSSFLNEAQRNSLPYSEQLTKLTTVCEWFGLREDRLQIKDFMSAKKSCEVDSMTEVCAGLAKVLGLNRVVDFGSGRGYLGCQMALMHDLQVLGIDSCVVRTTSAQNRTRLLHKHWKSVVRNAENDLQATKSDVMQLEDSNEAQTIKSDSPNEKVTVTSFGPTNNQHVQVNDYTFENNKTESVYSAEKSTDPLHLFSNDFVDSSKTNKCSTLSVNSSLVRQDDGSEDESKQGQKPVIDCCFRKIENNSSSKVGVLENSKSTKTIQKVIPLSNASSKQESRAGEEYSNCAGSEIRSTSDVRVACSETYNCTELVSTPQGITPLSLKKKTQQKRQNKGDFKDIVTNKDCKKSFTTVNYKTLTHFITTETDLLEKFEVGFPDTPSAEAPDLLATGLHACGNLTSSMLKVFISRNEVAALCNVGCCYHLLTEDFLCDPFQQEEKEDFTEAGFPLSSYLKKRGCQLGRNARMLASQAPDKRAEHSELPPRSLFWRALLQVILKDLCGETRKDWKIGKLAAKCSSFKEYSKKALRKLHIDKQLTDNEIQAYEDRYADEEHKLIAFVQLRSVLAPCIEAAILLDRLAFLLEQDCVSAAHLVQLFDPVVSPRCYGLLSWKKPASFSKALNTV